MTHDMAPNPKAATDEEKQAQQGGHLPIADRLPRADTSSSEDEVDDNASPQAAGYQPLETTVNAGTSSVGNDNNSTPDALTTFPRAMRQDFEEALATAQERYLENRDFAVRAPPVDSIPMDEDKVRHIKALMAKIPPPEKATPTWLDDERWQAALKQRISHRKQHEDFADFDSPEANNAK